MMSLFLATIAKKNRLVPGRGAAWCFAIGVAISAVFPARAGHESAPPTIELTVDATSVVRRVVHARMTIPAKPGPLTLCYPKWIPGTHGPNGPIGRLGGLRITANGKSVSWKRDSLDLFAFHCEVPDGASAIDAELIYAIPASPPALDVSAGVVASNNLAFLNWNALVLCPQGAPARECRYTARLRLPSGWKHASALPAAKVSDKGIEFETVTLERLIDSPVLAGLHLRSYPLKVADGVPHFLDVATESASGSDLNSEFLQQVTRLADEAGALFGTRHYRRFHFLLALSDKIPSFGLEHHESTVNSASPRGLTSDLNARWWLTFLLAHEYAHSWNGKHRRPADMITTTYQDPQQFDLLWAYEGLTQYLGLVLDARSGFWNTQQFRDELASTTGNMDRANARAWRPLLDTAVAAPLGAAAWGSSWRGQSDYYYEGALIWLEADTIIRQASAGRHSLDDFCRAFFGGAGVEPTVHGYRFEDVIAALTEIAPHDWKTFLASRLAATNEHAPTGGIERSGWRLVYSDTPVERSRSRQGRDMSFSLGFIVTDNGSITDVLEGTLAAKAGLSPGMRVLRVNDHAWSADAMKGALSKGKQSSDPLILSVDNEGTVKTYQFDYHGGERFPHLDRNTDRPDVMGEALKPKTR
jgi:predicted metalloprotease with PDZ domain